MYVPRYMFFTKGTGIAREKLYERRDIYEMSGKIVKSQHTSQAALGAEGNLWTTALATAVFVK